MSNLLCKCGLHNWKLIDIESIEQIEANVEHKIRAESYEDGRPVSPAFRVICEPFGRGYKHKKICRRCEKIVDTIAPYVEKIKPKVLQELELEKKGKNG